MDIRYTGELVMNVAEVKKHIKDKKPLSYYVFTGEEIEVMNIFINKIAEVSGSTLARVDSLSSVISALQNRSFLSPKTCYVIRDDKEYMSAENLWEKFESGEIQQGNIVIMLYTNLDKRSKFYKHSENRLVIFESLSHENLKREIQKRINLSDSNTDKLIDICEGNLGRILMEIDKIKSYHQGYRLPADGYYDGVFEDLLKDGTIYQPAQDCIWDFVEAVLTHKPKRSFGLMQEALEFGNPTLTLISVLYKDTKQLLQVQACPYDDVAKSTGLSGWDIKRARSRIDKYSNRELINAMKIIREAEKGIKSGNIEESMALDYILINIL